MIREPESAEAGAEVRRAAAIIRRGGLVAFPTETVYGLGANALDAQAAGRIFAAKGRPSTSPLIVHAASVEMARGLARRWPEGATKLAARYWPGPLTLVLPKDPRIPDAVTAGLDTVGLRVPAHPLALALIREAGVPIAAPSANRFSELSPTTAQHVRESLGSRVDYILDGGPTTVGIESTVLSLAGEQPVLLRPGMIPATEIEALVGAVLAGSAPQAGPHASPGMHEKHYAPRTPLLLLGRHDPAPRGRGIWLRFGGGADSVNMPADPRRYAAILYDTLHALDARGYDWLAVETPPDTPEWSGVLDRLRRASRR